MSEILQKVSAEKSKIEEHFQYLHQHPGLAFEEDVAAKYIAGKNEILGSAGQLESVREYIKNAKG